MLIRHLTIGGLRSYAPAPQRIGLAPLTLVFGPNSAGKSSLLSVLPMLAQTAARPDVLSMSGDLVEGGSFRMAVHCHDVEAPMTLGFGWTSDEGVARDAAISFKWDPSRRAAIRSHTELADGDERASIDGPRPWGSQPGVALHHRVTEEFWGTLERVYFVGPMRARAERTTLVGQGIEDYVGPGGRGDGRDPARPPRPGRGRQRVVRPARPGLPRAHARPGQPGHRDDRRGVRGAGPGGRAPRPAGPGLLAGRGLRGGAAAADHRAVPAHRSPG